MNELRTNRDVAPDAELEAAVRRRREHVALGLREGERTLGQNLALIGALGWTIVAPLLLGILLGRWLDGRFDSGYAWTLVLLLAGLVLGAVLAWKRMQRE